ncbi:DNA helicase RecQ [Ruminococcus sp. NK3A76]|uniref:DNA helicase RecQ n=1 Tax=Ruminococcus sp. NK3A76 TaxID=877411 RepID=UPI000569587B|nr:DNA helicase RecQ [Ruminococcus sp. NK3A76]
MDKHSVLKGYFGHDSFREGQEVLVDAILSGHDALGIMPTGAGKSICYQVPALLMRGITIVVSPLISLMKDQVNALIGCGVRAAYLNSSLSAEQYGRALTLASQGAFSLIYCAPERLLTPSFLSFAENADIAMVTVDEAHCVSQWGQDFRPSYLRIPEFISRLRRRPIVSAFTATATQRVKEDIISMLRLNSPEQVVTSFDRQNLYFGVESPPDKYERLCGILERNTDKSGIIYATSRKNVEELCERLSHDGYSVTRYHAGLDDVEKHRNQDDFLYDRKRIMVATNAFGMGIDKSNVSFVIHFNMPLDIESYYQEAGRCGRDGSFGECILLFSQRDVRTCRYMIEHDSGDNGLDEQTLAIVKKGQLARLDKMQRYCQTTDCLRGYILRYFGEKAPDRCTCSNKGGCSNCDGEFEDMDITIESQKVLSCVYRLAQRKLSFGEAVIADILKGRSTAKVTGFSLETLSTFGIMPDSTLVSIKRIIRFLETEGCLAKNAYGSYELTSRARAVLIERKPVKMKVPKKTPVKALGTSKAGRNIERSTTRPELFWRLRSLRNRKAQEEKLPAYIIFNDSSLRDMCEKLPRTEEEFMYISGVGEAKCRKYAKDFTAEICRFLDEQKRQQTVK